MAGMGNKQQGGPGDSREGLGNSSTGIGDIKENLGAAGREPRDRKEGLRDSKGELGTEGLA